MSVQRMRPGLLTILSIVALSFAASASETLTKAEAEAELNALPFPATWQADTRTEIRAGQDTLEMRGTYMRKGDLAKTTMMMNLGGRTTTMKTVQDTNQIRWTEMSAGPGETDVYRQDLARIADATGLPVGSAVSSNDNPAISWKPLFETLGDDEQVAVEDVDGDERLVFKVPATDEITAGMAQGTPLAGVELDRMTVIVGRNDGILREIRMQTVDGSSGYALTYDNIEVDVEIPDREFEYTPPADANVVDVTQMSIQESQQSAPQQRQLLPRQ